MTNHRSISLKISNIINEVSMVGQIIASRDWQFIISLGWYQPLIPDQHFLDFINIELLLVWCSTGESILMLDSPEFNLHDSKIPGVNPLSREGNSQPGHRMLSQDLEAVLAGHK